MGFLFGFFFPLRHLLSVHPETPRVASVTPASFAVGQAQAGRTVTQLKASSTEVG